MRVTGRFRPLRIVFEAMRIDQYSKHVAYSFANKKTSGEREVLLARAYATDRLDARLGRRVNQ